MSTNCERRRDLGAVQLAMTSSYSTSAVSCCAHSEQLNMSRSQPGVPVRAMSYSRIARPQLGHAGVLPTGCSGDLNKLNWGIAPLLAIPTNSQQRNLFRDWFCHGLREQLRAHVRFGSLADKPPREYPALSALVQPASAKKPFGDLSVVDAGRVSYAGATTWQRCRRGTRGRKQRVALHQSKG